MQIRSLIAAAVFCSLAAAVHADVQLFAAGSLRGAMSEVTTAFTRQSGIAVQAEYGPSGLLREKIENGGRVGVFVSADMNHPRQLAASGLGSATIRFTGNRLCALARPDVGLTTDNLLDKALSPGIKVGTSTPKADPGGDYTWKVFDKSEQVRPGAAQALKAKALQLVGGPNSKPVPAGQSVLPHLLATGQADMFIAYCTTSQAAIREGAKLDIVQLPAALAQSADYGMTVVGKDPAAAQLALYIMSEPGQAILAKWGFESRSGD